MLQCRRIGPQAKYCQSTTTRLLRPKITVAKQHGLRTTQNNTPHKVEREKEPRLGILKPHNHAIAQSHESQINFIAVGAASARPERFRFALPLLRRAKKKEPKHKTDQLQKACKIACRIVISLDETLKVLRHTSA
eukprot:c8406_g1_i1.p1 GENE.c8406_g1_i1~~c8406_g1_i1.p1  ORF type:complete len:135 (+),score=25.69 c8406_g1_i1:541-945(+)